MRKTVWFPAEEYESRVKKVRELMAREGIDVLFITGDRNYNYFTGNRPVMPLEGTVARPNCFLLPLEGDAHLLVHVFLQGDAGATTWIENISTYSSLLESPVKQLADLIRGFNTKGKKIGVELGHEQRIGMPVRDFLALRDMLGDFEFVDAASILWEMRMIKSPRELECVRRAMDITSVAYEKGLPQVKEGMSEREIACILGAEAARHGAETFWSMVTSGPGNYGRISGKPTDRKVRKGDMVWVDGGAMVNDYWADFSRAGVIGGPTAEQKKYQQIVIEATAEGVAAMKPGERGARIVDVCEEALRKRGVDISFTAGRVGHGIGLLFTEPPSLARWDPMTLQENMVLSVEPGLVRDDGVYHAEENVVVTAEGAEVLSKAAPQLSTLG